MTSPHPFSTMKLTIFIKVLPAAAAITAIHAQDLEPRAYSNSPTGLTFAISSYTYSKGTVLTDPALPIDNANIESHTAAFALATTQNVFGKSAKFAMVIPYSSLAGEADLAVPTVTPTGELTVTNVHRERFVTDFGDPFFRFSINFYGAPAMTMEEFPSYKQNVIVGASLRVGVPLGDYDEDKILNIGSNRWSLRPEVGISKALGPVTLEVAPGITFYTENSDYFNGQTREQAPLFSVQGNISYSIGPLCWLAINGSFFSGGRSTVDGSRNQDELQGGRIGATLALPLNRHASVKIYAMRGLNAELERDLDIVGIALQYRFGGGY